MSWKGSTSSIEALMVGWPDGCSIAGLAYERSEAMPAAVLADRLARAVAVYRDHTLLADVSGDGVLDASLGGAEGPGLSGALNGVARLTDVAVHREGQPYVYLPEGESDAGAGSLLEAEAFRSFAARVRERGGTLLLFMPSDAFGTRAIRDVLDGYVVLGAAKLSGYPEPPCHGVVALDAVWPPAEAVPQPATVSEPASSSAPTEAPAAAAPAEPPATEPQPAADASNGAEPGEPVGAGRDGASELWQRHRSHASFPVGKVLIGAAVMVILLAGWWAFAAGVATGADPDGTTMSAPATGPPEVVDGAAARPSEAELLAAQERTAPLTHSVLIASHTRRPDAMAHLLDLRAAGHPGLFVAPTPLRTRTYFRVFEGAYPSRAAALEAIPRLVETGVKEEASDWDARPARHAFRAGVFASRREAEEAKANLGGLDPMAYVVGTPWPGDGDVGTQQSSPPPQDSLWTLYLGGFESTEAADLLADELEQASVDAPLLERLGARTTSDESRPD